MVYYYIKIDRKLPLTKRLRFSVVEAKILSLGSFACALVLNRSLNDYAARSDR